MEQQASIKNKRILKFRGWDKETNSMFNVYELRWKTNGTFLGGGDTWFTDMGMAPAIEWSIDIMQYTGVKDKNGIEVYEGDIICHERGGEKTYNEVKYEILEGTHSNNEFYGINVDNIKGGYVCGNIYQNPELLTNF